MTRLLTLAAALLLAATPALAQTGSLEGTVRDDSGALLPGATVLVADTPLGAATDSEGRFRIEAVPAGPQTVEVRFVGFAPVRRPVSVQVGQVTRLDVVLSDAAPGIGTATVIGAREQGYRATTALQVNRSAAPIQETPFSVQVVTQDLLRDRGVTDFEEALRYVPGLAPEVGFNASNDLFTIRGFRADYTYRNGFRQSAYSVGNQIANVEQIEVLKGAASALVGRAEPGGIVNVVTKRPTPDRFVTVAGRAGSFSTYRATVDANVPLSGSLGVRLNASYDDRGGYRDLAFSREAFVAPVVEWRPGDRTSLVAEAEYGDLRAFPDRGFGNDARFLDAPRERQFAGSDGRLSREGGLATAILTHRLSDAVSLRAAAAYSEFTIRSLYYGYGFPVLTEGATPDVTLRPTTSLDNQTNTTAQVEATARFRTGAARHTALVGVEAGQDRWGFDFQRGPAVVVPFSSPDVPTPAQGPYDPFFAGRIDANASALYVQDEATLGPVRLLLGARLDRNRALDVSTAFGTSTAFEKAETQLSPRAGLTWLPAPEVALYASAARSFAPQPLPLAGGEVAGALRGTGFETGVKLSLLDGRLRPTASVFELRRSNAAVSDPDDFTLFRIIGESRSRGVEVDVSAALTPQWRALATYAFLDAEVVEDTALEPGTDLPNAPDHSAGLWTSYDLTGALQGLTVGLGVLRIGERSANAFGSIRIPAYTRLDASVSYTARTPVGPLRAQVEATNLTDAFFYEAGGAFLPVFPAAPRMVSGSVALTL